MARVLSLPVDRDEFASEIVNSYRVKQGVLHNPRSDRRTTQGIFHVAEGGLPIPDDKIGGAQGRVRQDCWAWRCTPPRSLMRLPFTATQPQPAECFVSLLLRPLVCPAVPGLHRPRRAWRSASSRPAASSATWISSRASSATAATRACRRTTPAWTWSTGPATPAASSWRRTWSRSPSRPPACRTGTRPPNASAATACAGATKGNSTTTASAFKLTCRDETGVIVTLIADNYFGYCKKEVKTQISYAANLYGLCEEEHAGGALVFPSYDLGEEFSGDVHVKRPGPYVCGGHRSLYRDVIELKPEGYAVDQQISRISSTCRRTRGSTCTGSGSPGPAARADTPSSCFPARPTSAPRATRCAWKSPARTAAWRLVGTVAEGTLCHKPCTVSGGGKSEISKPITDAILTGPVFVADFKSDFDQVAELIDHDYGGPVSRTRHASDQRPILSAGALAGLGHQTAHARRPATTRPEYNAWLESDSAIHQGTGVRREALLQARMGRRLARPFQRRHHQRQAGQRIEVRQPQAASPPICASGFDAGRLLAHLRPAQGFLSRRSKSRWRTTSPPRWSCRRAGSTDLPEPAPRPPSLKFVQNAETRLFQRPDDAIHRGYDKQTEADFAAAGQFLLELRAAAGERGARDDRGRDRVPPVHRADAGPDSQSVADDGRHRLLRLLRPPAAGGRQAEQEPALSPDPARPAQPAARVTWPKWPRGCAAGCPRASPCYKPVAAVLPGRRNNPPEARHPLAGVFNPIHYFELPELFMEFICSMTGKSPSTTGAGSEGALTKGPFNALPPIIDLNNALVSCILTGHRRLRDRRRLRRAARCAWTTTSACWCRKSGAACRRRNATRDS